MKGIVDLQFDELKSRSVRLEEIALENLDLFLIWKGCVIT